MGVPVCIRFACINRRIFKVWHLAVCTVCKWARRSLVGICKAPTYGEARGKVRV